MDRAPGSAPPDGEARADGASERPYYSVSQAAALLGVSRVTIWRWIRSGRLRAVRLGHRIVRVKGEDLGRLLAQGGSAGQRESAPGASGDEAAPGVVAAHQEKARALEAAVARREQAEERLRAAEQRLAVQDAVARALAESRTPGEASAHMLRAIGEGLGWDTGILWTVDRSAGVLWCAQIWHLPPLEIAEVEAVSRAATLRPGVGLPGRVWASGRPIWIPDAVGDESFPGAAAAARAGLHAAFGFPIRVGGDVLGVMELLSREIKEPDENVLALAAAVGGQIGQLLERWRAEGERDASEERLRIALEAGRMGTWDWTVATGKVEWSPNMEAIHGLRPGAFGGTFEDFARDIHPEDRPVVLESIARAVETGVEYQVEYRTTWPDGSLHWLEARGRTFRDQQGRPVRMRGVCADVTERKQAETRLRTRERQQAVKAEQERAARAEAQRAAERTRRLQEITGQLSESLEADEVLATIARSAADLLQVPVGAVFLLAEGEPEGDFILAAAHGIDEARVRDLRLPRRASLAGRAVDEGRTLVVDDVRETPGTALPALLTGQPAGSEIAAPITAGAARLGVVKAFSPAVRRFSPDDAALLSTLGDAAAVALTNARLYREAQDAVRARDEFLAAATHDLKTPLTTIKGMAQLLRRQLMRINLAGAGRVLEGLAGIDAAATKMAQQLDELLDLTCLQMGERLGLRRDPADLVGLARQVVAEQQQTTRRHRIRIETSLPALVGTWDRARLGRVLENILSNAIKYSPEPGDIVVTVAREDSAGQPRAVLAVRDDGLGIPAADLPRIFERFQRAGNVVGRISGTGIGLASVRQIVEQHGGTIAVESREGEGSIFTVRLPLELDACGHIDPAPERAAR